MECNLAKSSAPLSVRKQQLTFCFILIFLIPRSLADLSNPEQQAAAQQDTREQQPRTLYVADKMPGRNDPCPCGSGKKFKNCHGRGLV